MKSRNRFAYAKVAVIVVFIGLGSRYFTGILKAFGKYPGDALWTVLVFLLWAIARPNSTSRCLLVLALCTSYLVEFSQLLTWPWLMAIRKTTFGHLVLGSTYNTTDLLAYTIGGILAWSVDFLFFIKALHHKSTT